MTTKKLYILVSDGGDGSYYPNYTFDADFIKKLEEAYEDDRMNYENGIGCDGDGFHYEVLNVPVECTAESLGVTLMDPKEYEHVFEGEGE